LNIEGDDRYQKIEGKQEKIVVSPVIVVGTQNPQEDEDL
jgi:hypothetical protein